MPDYTYPIGEVEDGLCPWCASVIPPHTGKRPRKWCSKWCGGSASHFRITGEVREKKPPNTHCKGCGDPFEPGARGDRNPKKWCSTNCRVSYLRKNDPRAKEWAKRGQERQRAKIESEREPAPKCSHCGEVKPTRRGKYCSKRDCQNANRRARSADVSRPLCSRDGCERPVNAKGLCNSHYAMEWAQRNRSVVADREALRRARKRGADAGDVSRDLVLERDRWRCGICGDLIPKDAVYPDLMSPSIDHVVPLSQGGAHSMANVQASHFVCNSKRQARGGGEQLAIV